MTIESTVRPSLVARVARERRIATWIPTDLLLSIRAGVSGEVVFVSAGLLAFGVPLVFLWPYFRGGVT